LTVPQTWQQSHPQSVHLLQQEVQTWSKTHLRLNLT
jgi:hypothetical protein